MAATGVEEQVLAANVRLLTSIRMVTGQHTATHHGKGETLCSAVLTVYGLPGLPFHKYYFDMPSNGSAPARNTVLARPKVQLLADGKVAIITYARLTQILGDTAVAQETRVWEQRGGKWVHVHFHKST